MDQASVGIGGDGAGVTVVPLTDKQRRVIFRALNVTALLVEMEVDWATTDGVEHEELRMLAREVLPEGIGAS